jgi:hypothetical protein
MSEDLKPCPFCGGDAEHYYRADDSGWENTDWVGCTGNCGASTACYETKDLAVTVWNTRIDTDDMADRNKKLRAENKRLKSLVADVIHSMGDDPEIMAASRAEWAARALEAEAKLSKSEALLAKVAAGLERAKTFFQVTHCHASIDDTIAELSSVSCANSKGESDES